MRAANIMLVDDNRFDVELTLETFQQMRLSNAVQVATSGRMALDYLRGREQYASRNQYPFPDLMLLDLHMPGLDGLDLLREVKDSADLRDLAVVLLATSHADGLRLKQAQPDVAGYLVKPVSVADFVDLVAHLDDCWLTLATSTAAEQP